MVFQPLTIDPELSGASWGLARIVRRRAPWNVSQIRLPLETTYESLRDGTGVDLYMVDSGIDLSHAEVSGRATNVYEFHSSGGVGDDHGHGTAVASVAAGNTCGPARGAEIFSFKCYNSAGVTGLSDVTACLNEVASHYASRSALNRPAVLSISVAGNLPGLGAPIGALIDAGMPVAAAVHNHGRLLDSFFPMHPAMVSDVLACGGIAMNDSPYYLGQQLDEFSTLQVGTNFGPEIDILAPSQSLRMARASFLGAGYRVWSGTSFAAPMVAGVIACMLQGKSRLTTRSQVQAVNAKVIENATTGRLRTVPFIGSLPDRIVYLDPRLAVESIPGVP